MSSLTGLASLAFGMSNNPAAYAILLGSGVSRGAGILTGHEILLDLIKRIAELNGCEVEGEPLKWFKANCEGEPSYSNVIEQLGRKGEERRRLLEPYFESKGLDGKTVQKVPSAAHRTVAKLMKAGFIRVVITTNFDRLLERALDDLEVKFHLIASPEKIDALSGLELEKNCVIKVHGDYLDSRMLNTEEELRSYDSRMERLIKNILSKHGLLTCGWSAVSDEALKNAIIMTENKHFSTFVTMKDSLTPGVEEIIKSKSARLLTIESADEFFSELSGGIEKILEIGAPKPAGIESVIDEAKQYLSDDTKLTRLHELYRKVFSEADQAWRSYRNNKSFDGSEKQISDCIVAYEQIAEEILPLTVLIGLNSNGSHDAVLVEAISQVGEEPPDKNGVPGVWLELSSYPLRMLFYAAGMASLLAQRAELFASLMLAPTMSSSEDERIALFRVMSVRNLSLGAEFAPSFERGGGTTSSTGSLRDLLRQSFRTELPEDRDYDFFFDEFEIYLALLLKAKRGGISWNELINTWLFTKEESLHWVFRRLKHPIDEFRSRAFFRESLRLMEAELDVDQGYPYVCDLFNSRLNCL